MQISRLRLISVGSLVAMLFATFSSPANAYDQWSWTAAGQTFASKQQAAAYMRSQSPTSRYQYYTIETLSALTATTATYDYTAPNRDPNSEPGVTTIPGPPTSIHSETRQVPKRLCSRSIPRHPSVQRPRFPIRAGGRPSKAPSERRAMSGNMFRSRRGLTTRIG